MEVELRKVRSDDVDDEFISWYQNTDGHLNFFSGSRKSFSRVELGRLIDESDADDRNFYYLIIADNGDKIGTVRIGPVDHSNKTSDLVCLVGNRNYLGKGLAKKAIRKANRIAFDEHDIRRLQSGMFEAHIASIKAYTGADWFIEGRMKGFYLVDGEPMDRVCVACLNPKYFPDAGRAS